MSRGKHGKITQTIKIRTMKYKLEINSKDLGIILNVLANTHDFKVECGNWDSEIRRIEKEVWNQAKSQNHE